MRVSGVRYGGMGKLYEDEVPCVVGEGDGVATWFAIFVVYAGAIGPLYECCGRVSGAQWLGLGKVTMQAEDMTLFQLLYR
jgi:hypothetical protein